MTAHKVFDAARACMVPEEISGRSLISPMKHAPARRSDFGGIR